jgi:hypothetical protein
MAVLLPFFNASRSCTELADDRTFPNIVQSVPDAVSTLSSKQLLQWPY